MRILLVDDHPSIRRAVRTVLEVEQTFEVVGEAECAEEALLKTQRLEPKVVILDLMLKGEKSGIEVCREMKGWPEPPYILLYTAYNSADNLLSCRLSGADAYVHKSEDATTLLDILDGVHTGDGKWLLGSEIEEPDTKIPTTGQCGLSARETEIFGLLRQRRTNSEIAQELFINTETVKTHVANVLRKLGFQNRREIS